MVRADPRCKSYDPRYARPLSSSPPGGWGEIDAAFLEEARPRCRPFPLDLLPPFWRDWVRRHRRRAGAPADYVAQSVLAAVSGLGGAGASVRIGPRWDEPLVLWQALVGAAVQRQVAGDGAGARAAGDARRGAGEGRRRDARARARWSRRPRSAPSPTPSRPTGAASCCGATMARIGWLGAPETARRPVAQCLVGAGALSLGNRRRIDRFAVSLLLALSTERLAGLLTSDELAAPLPVRLAGAARALPARRLQAGARRRSARSTTPHRGQGAHAGDPLELVVDQRGLKAFDGFLAGLASELRGETDGLEMAWLGKGRGTVARLAGVLELLAWSEPGPAGPPGQLGAEQIERGVRLWSDYFRPHAFALFHRLVPSESERQARRVVRWLRQRGLGEVSREQVRRRPCSRSVNASDADQVLYRLQAAGYREQGPLPDSRRAAAGHPTGGVSIRDSPPRSLPETSGNLGNLPGR